MFRRRGRHPAAPAMLIVFMAVTSFLYFWGLVFGADLPEIKKAGVLRHLGIPYANFVSEDGSEGLDVELLTLYAQHLGVKYQYVPTGWETVIGDLTGKKFVTSGDHVTVVGEAPVKGDILANGFTVLPLREKMMDYSVPTFPTQIWLIARADSPITPIKPSGDIDKDILAVRSLLKGQRLLGKADTCLDPSLYNLKAAGAEGINFAGSLNELVPGVIQGEAPLSLLDMPDALIALEKWSGQFKIIGPLSPPQSMACAFAKENQLLRQSFNEFFEKIVEDGTYIKLVDKYYPFFSRFYPEHFKKGPSPNKEPDKK